MNKIFYASAYVEGMTEPDEKGSTCALAGSLVAHFYIAADDELEAGSFIPFICQRYRIQFVDFIYLPGQETQDTVHALVEHQFAFQEASRNGEALLLSVVMNGSRRVLDVQGD